jgi:hypothetical protein
MERISTKEEKIEREKKHQAREKKIDKKERE